MRLVQLTKAGERRIAIVQEPELLLLQEPGTLYALALRSLEEQTALTELATAKLSGERLNYDHVYGGTSAWKLLAPIDVPGDPQKLLVSGTGLTHLGSARERQAMHTAPGTLPEVQEEAELTDSMRMFTWGQQNGRPAEGQIGIAPEWFYKGDGSILRGTSDPLLIPGHAEDGGEEAEIAALYIVDASGVPHRIGLAVGNEFSDHVFERKNYLNLAGSKLRECSLGPELVVGEPFDDVAGSVRILREGAVVWEKAIRTGKANMAHSLENLEHHHFKFAGHRQAGMVHVHFLGADALSFGQGVRLQQGDVTEVAFDHFGRTLRNTIAEEARLLSPVRVKAMR